MYQESNLYFNNKKIDLLTEEELKELFDLYYKSDEIEKIKYRNKIVEHNIRLVFKVSSLFPNFSLSDLDIIQEGTLGLIAAVDRFDSSRNVKFSTFAYPIIKQFIYAALHEYGNGVHIPSKRGQNNHLIKNARKKFVTSYGIEPTLKQLSDLTGLSINYINDLYTNEFLKGGDTPISLQSPIGEDGDSTLGDFIEDKTLSPDDLFYKSELTEQLQRVLDNVKLSEREIEIIKLKYGFYNDVVYNNAEIAEKFNITRERVRVLINKTLTKIRKSENIELITPYFSDYDCELPTEEIKKKIKLNYNNTVYEDYPEYDRSDVDAVLEFVSIDHLDKLIMRYGNDYNVPNLNIDPKDKETRIIIYNLVKTMNLYFESYFNDEYFYQKKEIHNLKKNKICPTIYQEFYMFKKEDIDYVYNYIYDIQKENILICYGEDLNVNFNTDVESLDYKNKLMKFKAFFKSHLKSYIKNPEKYENKEIKITRPDDYVMTIYEQFSEFTESQIDDVIKKLTKPYGELLKIRYGTDYKVSYISDDINTVEYKNNEIKILPIIRYYLRRATSEKMLSDIEKNNDQNKIDKEIHKLFFDENSIDSIATILECEESYVVDRLKQISCNLKNINKEEETLKESIITSFLLDYEEDKQKKRK
ncbi:MAG: sigma-70 family RNA polymerase sigma factor [bacterium]